MIPRENERAKLRGFIWTGSIHGLEQARLITEQAGHKTPRQVGNLETLPQSNIRE
jgi:hypothetical protein